LVGVTEQDWLVYEPNSTPLVHVRVCDVQLPPQVTDEPWYAVMLAPSAISGPPQGEAHGRVHTTFCVGDPAQAAPLQAGTGLLHERAWDFCPATHVEVSAHALHPPSVGVTEQDLIVNAPESTPLVHVRVCAVQLPPQATDEFW